MRARPGELPALPALAQQFHPGARLQIDRRRAVAALRVVHRRFFRHVAGVVRLRRGQPGLGRGGQRHRLGHVGHGAGCREVGDRAQLPQHRLPALGVHRRMLDAAQPGVDARHQLPLVRHGARHQRRLHAPQQQRHHRRVTRGIVLATVVGQARLRQHLRPRPGEEGHHFRRRRSRIGPIAQLQRDALGEQVALFGAQQRAHGLFAPAAARVRLGPRFAQRAQCDLERLAAGGARFQQHFHGLLQAFDEIGEARRLDTAPGQAALRDLLEQLAGGMLAIAEETRIGQRHAQQRRLEVAHGLLHRGQQPRVAGEMFEHQVHDLEPEQLRR